MKPIPACLLLAGVLAPSVAGREATSSTQDQPRPFVTGTTAIVIDAVVRDGRGRPVTDLGREDFELLENGVAQEIADVTLIAPPGPATPVAASRGSSTSSPPAPAAAVTPRIVFAPAFVALVFDRLSHEGRALAHKGALAYLDTFHQDDFAGVFLSDMSLVMIQTFTNDRAQLKRAVDEAARRAGAPFDRAATSDSRPSCDGDPELEHTVDRKRRIGGPLTRCERGTRADSTVDLPIDVQQLGDPLARAAAARDDERAARLTGAMGLLPGRKTVEFFAEGLALPDGVLPHSATS